MFGYVTVNRPELKFKEFALYRSYYCGLCDVLRERFGPVGQFTLTYDMTFLVMLLTSLYEPHTEKKEFRCRVHPVKACRGRVNEITEYAADIEVILAYYKCIDDWNDERRFSRLAVSKLLESPCRAASGRQPAKAAAIRKGLKKLYVCEASGDTDLDRAAGLFGEIVAEIFDMRGDVWSQTLREMGFYLGKFIYLMDAYEDLEKDRERGNYNPLLRFSDSSGFDKRCEQLLSLMMARCCRAFEILPVVRYSSVLRNILYSGVWTRFSLVRKKRESENVTDRGLFAAVRKGA